MIIMLWIVLWSDVSVHCLQIVIAVLVIQKLLEIAKSTATSSEVMAFNEHVTSSDTMLGKLIIFRSCRINYEKEPFRHTANQAFFKLTQTIKDQGLQQPLEGAATTEH